MEHKTILVADDEMRMRRVIRDYLQIKGYTVLEASDGLEALSLLERRGADLVLLDVMMPHMDGFETCRRIRRRCSLGADEYVTKPFSLKVLLARVEAVLRRQERQPVGPITDADGLTVDTAGRVVRVDGAPVELTYTEYELLLYLVSNRGIALSRDRILENVWRFDYEGDARTVDTHIKKLRCKLGARGDYIRTVRGIGYKFDPHPEGAR